ncbi:MAG: molybdopterin-synthase adenylyltransferase MoeB [Rubricoccaceae bacterium]
MLSSFETERYDRQLRLPRFGPAGQEALKAASVLVVGAGGLGTPSSLYLAAAGVGRIGLVDFDVVEGSNLHRQVLYSDADIGHPKADALAARLREVNPHVAIEAHSVALTAENAVELIQDYDLVADGTDRFESRYLVNDACVLTGTPNVFASVNQFDGQLSVFGLANQPCYRCVFPEPPPAGLVPSCAEGGVLGVLPGLLGTMQATEAIKVLAGIGTPLGGQLLLVDALSMSFRTIHVERDPECAVCGDHPVIHAPHPTPTLCTPTMAIPEITVHDLHALSASGERPLVVDVRQPGEYAIGNIDGVLIPLNELPDRLGELESHRTDEQIVLQCRSGGRSGKAVEFLQGQGFTNVVNLKGGILAWSAEIDPSVSTEMPA